MLHVIEADRSMSSLKDTGASPGTSDTSECPICCEHAPTSQLSSSGNFAPNGVWMGPHCAACERRAAESEIKEVLVQMSRFDVVWAVALSGCF